MRCPEREPRVKAYMGIDIGSISTNVAVIDSEGRLLSKRYLMTAGRPIEAVRQGLRETAAELGDRVEIAGVGTTGSGRYMIADYVGADIVKNEITAQATAAVFIDPAVDTIFEIGGQDSKYISIENGCDRRLRDEQGLRRGHRELSGGAGREAERFGEERVRRMRFFLAMRRRSSASAAPCSWKTPSWRTSRRAPRKSDLFAGLAYSIVQNYMNRVVAGRRIGRNIFFQGGVAFNKSVVAAFEKHLGMTCHGPAEPRRHRGDRHGPHRHAAHAVRGEETGRPLRGSTA